MSVAPAYAIAVRGAFWAGIAANVLVIASLPLWGRLSDRIGRKPVMMGSMASVAVLTFPLNAMIGSSAVGLLVAMAIFGGTGGYV